MKNNIAVIMAGGKGTRLSSITNGVVPKPMVKIQGKPILEYTILNLASNSISLIYLVVSKFGERYIKEYFGNGEKFGVSIEYLVEDSPLGTAGALYFLKNKVVGDFILAFGDILLNLDWSRFVDYHTRKNATVTLFAHPNSHPYDSDVLEVDSDGILKSILKKNHERNFYYKNLVNAGLYVVNSKILDLIVEPKFLDFEKDILNSLIDERNVYCYTSSEYVKDIGTPERYAAASMDFENGIIDNRNLSKKQKCIFLDRDGTINKFVGLVKNHDQIELINNVSKAISLVNSSGYLCIVITNQPVIARGECTFEEMTIIHNKIETLLGNDGAYLDGLYFCPHHPDGGYNGEIKELKIICDCRKPNIGLITKAQNDFNIDLSKSWFIGDTSLDIQTGINAGTKTILINGSGAESVKKYKNKPTYEANSLYEAVKLILSEENYGF